MKNKTLEEMLTESTGIHSSEIKIHGKYNYSPAVPSNYVVARTVRLLGYLLSDSPPLVFLMNVFKDECKIKSKNMKLNTFVILLGSIFLS